MSSLPRIAGAVLAVALGGVLAWFLGAQLTGSLTVPWPSAWSPQATILVSLAFLLVALTPLIHALRFGYLLRMRGMWCGLRILAEVHYAERFLTPLLPFRMSLPAKALLLQRGGVRLDLALSASLLDFALETGLTLSIAVLGAPLLVRTPLSVLGAVAVALAVAFVLLTPGRLEGWSRRFREGSLLRRTIEFFRNLRVEAGELIRNPRLLGLLFFMLVTQLLVVVSMDLLLRAVGHSLPWPPLLAVVNASLLLGSATAIPSGWGARELAMAGFLGLSGVDATSAVWVALMFRLTTLPPMVIGYFSAIRIGWSWKEARKLRPVP